MNVDTQRYLESVEAKHATHYTEAVGDLLVAIAMGNRPDAADARKRLQQVIAETMGIGEVLGAASMLRDAAKVLLSDRGAKLGAHMRDLVCFRESSNLLANVTFQEALQDLIDRTPVVLRDAAARTAQAISKLYSEGRVVAFARSAELAVTQRVQDLIAQAMREGIGEVEAGTNIRMGVEQVRTETEAWTEGYSRMAFRTNLNTAVTAGRFRQAQHPDVRAVVPCFRFESVGDSDTRDNHGAADGRIWRTDNPIWNRLAPPLGFNCRCRVSMVPLPDLRRMGRVRENGDITEDGVPPDAYPDPGFRHIGRPDLFIVSLGA